MQGVVLNYTGDSIEIKKNGQVIETITDSEKFGVIYGKETDLGVLETAFINVLGDEELPDIAVDPNTPTPPPAVIEPESITITGSPLVPVEAEEEIELTAVVSPAGAVYDTIIWDYSQEEFYLDETFGETITVAPITGGYITAKVIKDNEEVCRDSVGISIIEHDFSGDVLTDERITKLENGNHITITDAETGDYELKEDYIYNIVGQVNYEGTWTLNGNVTVQFDGTEVVGGNGVFELSDDAVFEVAPQAAKYTLKSGVATIHSIEYPGVAIVVESGAKVISMNGFNASGTWDLKGGSIVDFAGFGPLSVPTDAEIIVGVDSNGDAPYTIYYNGQTYEKHFNDLIDVQGDLVQFLNLLELDISRTDTNQLALSGAEDMAKDITLISGYEYKIIGKTNYQGSWRLLGNADIYFDNTQIVGENGIFELSADSDVLVHGATDTYEIKAGTVTSKSINIFPMNFIVNSGATIETIDGFNKLGTFELRTGSTIFFEIFGVGITIPDTVEKVCIEASEGDNAPYKIYTIEGRVIDTTYQEVAQIMATGGNLEDLLVE
jgi:hypothetical protein